MARGKSLLNRAHNQMAAGLCIQVDIGVCVLAAISAIVVGSVWISFAFIDTNILFTDKLLEDYQTLSTLIIIGHVNFINLPILIHKNLLISLLYSV